MSSPALTPTPDRTPIQGSSIHYALRFLPAARRRPLLALHTFWRLTAELAHQPHDGQVAALQLAWWRTQVDQIARGQAPDHPALQGLGHDKAVAVALAPPLQTMLDAVETDLNQTRFLDQPALDRHALQSGGAALRCAVMLLGTVHPATLTSAEGLGQALAQTRMLRDLGLHLARGRLYLPLDSLRDAGLTVESLRQTPPPDRLTDLLHTQAARIEACFDQSLRNLPATDVHTLKPMLMLVALQRTLLRDLVAHDLPVLQQRVSLTPLRKLLLAWRFQALGRL